MTKCELAFLLEQEKMLIQPVVERKAVCALFCFLLCLLY